MCITKTILGIAVVCLIAVTAQAQQRAATPNDTLVSPEVQADHRVTFRIYAPRSAEVTVGGDWNSGGEPVKLQKGDNGVWSVTVGPLRPDFYIYTFNVDGVRTVDPKNPFVKPGITSVGNIVEIPGPEAEFESTQPVLHGDIRMVLYQSSTLGALRRMHVYTPPGYDRTRESYPVFYLLHGGGDEDAGWSTIGRAGFILDNLLAKKQAKPMIVVMPNGSMPPPATPTNVPASSSANPAQDTFAAELQREIMPYIEKNFRVLGGQDNRAIAGLSMGGGQTIRVVFANPELFGYVAVWSSGVRSAVRPDFEKRYSSFLDNSEKINRLLRVLSVSVGSKDPLANESAKNLVQLLQSRNIKHVFHESDGAHTWINWRQYLKDYLPLLFAEKKMP